MVLVFSCVHFVICFCHRTFCTILF